MKPTTLGQAVHGTVPHFENRVAVRTATRMRRYVLHVMRDGLLLRVAFPHRHVRVEGDR